MKIKVLLISLLLSLGVFAQEKEESSPKHAFGIHAGGVTGLGFSYRFFPKKFGVQVTGIPVFYGNGGQFYSVGLSGMYNLKSSRRVDLFAYLGNHLTINQPNNNYNPSTTSYHLGLGGGINLHAWIDVLDISFQIGYGVYTINEDPLSLPTGEIGFYYRF